MTNPFLRPDGQPYLIAEFGSCHLGKLENIKRAVDECVFHGIDALKLQLFPNQEPYVPTNVYLPQEMFLRAFEYANGKGLTLTASVFGGEELLFLSCLNPKWIKLSYSKSTYFAHSHFGGDKPPLLVSVDVMNDFERKPDIYTLYCIPEYPVRYEVDFADLFGSKREEWVVDLKGHGITRVTPTPGRFDGFSDHTLGIRQTIRAIKAGAMIIEKHVRLPETDIRSCPDARFSITIEELGKVRL